MKMKKNADWVAKRNAYRKCHSESRGTSGISEDRLAVFGGIKYQAKRIIFGFGKCGVIISNLQKSRL